MPVSWFSVLDVIVQKHKHGPTRPRFTLFDPLQFLPEKWGTANAEIKPPPLPPPGGSPGLSSVPLSKPVVGQNIAFHAVPAYRQGFCLLSFCLPGLLNFISS